MQPKHTFIAILSTVALHAAVLILVERSEPSKSVVHSEVTPLTYTIVEANINPPEQVPLAQAAENTASTQSPELASPKSSLPSKDSQDTQSVSSSLPTEDTGVQLPPSLPGLGLGVTKYFPSSALSSRPKAIDQPTLVLDGIDAFGQSKMTLYLNASGKVDEANIEQTNLPPALGEAVREAFLKMTFTPGEIAGKAVPSVMTIEVNIDAPSAGK